MAKAAIRMIPHDKLMLSPKNVRKTRATEAQDAELYASIKHHGLKQNLNVHEGNDGAFYVHAGGRRLEQMQKLVEDGHLKPDHRVACNVEEEEAAKETSMAKTCRAPTCTPPTNSSPLPS